MSPRRRDFESIMLSTRATLSLTTRRLSDGEFRAMIGMLCLAGDSQDRGLLLVGGTPATTDEIADFAKCREPAVQSAISKLLEMDTLEQLDDGTLAFTNWDRFQPAPRPSDLPAAARDRKARQRAKSRPGHAHVTRDNGPSPALVPRDNGAEVTPDSRGTFAGAIGRREVEVEEKPPQAPRRGVGERVGNRSVNPDTWATTLTVLAEFNRQAAKNLSATTGDGSMSESAKRIYNRVQAFPDLTHDEHADIIRRTLASRWWGDDAPSVGVVYGPKVFEDNITRVASSKPPTPTGPNMIAALNARNEAT